MANPLVHAALLGWIPFVFVLFAFLPARTAVLVAVFGAWMFLPVYGYDVRGLPPYTKETAAGVVVLLGALLFDPLRVTSVRPSWIDLPMALWCLCPIASSVSNGLGVYDGLSTALTHVFAWGAPYYIGRAYFADLGGLRALAMAVVVGGVVYAPLCLYEVKMSPQLHRTVYGFFQHGFAQTIRFGGFRPMVFMQHGLAVGMFMAGAALVASWLWVARSERWVWRLPMWLVAVGLLVTTFLCKSLGAAALLVAGMGALLAMKLFRTRLALAALAAVPLVYMTARSTGDWSGDGLADTAAMISPERADSLRTRLHNEDMLVARALQQPLFGWGGWNRARVIDDWGNDQSITDGLWIIALGNTGLVGLGSLTAALLLPPVLLLVRWKAPAWRAPAGAPVAALATLLVLHSVDNLFNAMTSPVFIIIAGGLAGLAAQRKAPARARVRRAAGRLSGGSRLRQGSREEVAAA